MRELAFVTLLLLSLGACTAYTDGLPTPVPAPTDQYSEVRDRDRPPPHPFDRVPEEAGYGDTSNPVTDRLTKEIVDDFLGDD